MCPRSTCCPPIAQITTDPIEVNSVTDPYSLGLSVDSQRSLVVDLDSAETKPFGWRDPHERARNDVDFGAMSLYELHVRDFSASDTSVSAAWRGKFLAFTDRQSRGMSHLRALAHAGLTHVHLLPSFDFPGGRRLIGLPLIALGTVIAAVSYWEWHSNQLAMRDNRHNFGSESRKGSPMRGKVRSRA